MYVCVIHARLLTAPLSFSLLQESVSKLQVFERGSLWRGNDYHHRYYHHNLHHSLHHYTLFHHGRHHAHCSAAPAASGRTRPAQEGCGRVGRLGGGIRPAATQPQRWRLRLCPRGVHLGTAWPQARAGKDSLMTSYSGERGPSLIGLSSSCNFLCIPVFFSSVVDWIAVTTYEDLMEWKCVMVNGLLAVYYVSPVLSLCRYLCCKWELMTGWQLIDRFKVRIPRSFNIKPTVHWETVRLKYILCFIFRK